MSVKFLILGMVYQVSSYPTAVNPMCQMNGFVRRNGEIWKPSGIPTSACVLCICQQGKAECRRCESSGFYGAATASKTSPISDGSAPVESHSLPFQYEPMPSRSAWPRYRGNVSPRSGEIRACFVGGVRHKHGDTFSGGNFRQIARDRSICTQCACVQGEKYCRTKVCPTVSSCSQQHFGENDCCPSCAPAMPNFPIHAEEDYAEESPKNAPLNHAENSVPFMQPSPTKGASLVRSCTFDGKQYENEVRWKAQLPRANGHLCIECGCTNGEAKCKMPKCDERGPTGECLESKVPADRCCAECVTIKNATIRPQESRNETQCRPVYHFVTKQVHSTSLNARNTTTPFNRVLAIGLSSSFRVYNWSLNADHKFREVLTLRQAVYEKFAAGKQHVGTFRITGYTNDHHLRVFQRKEGLWSKRCRRTCAERLRKILRALRLKPSTEECDNAKTVNAAQA